MINNVRDAWLPRATTRARAATPRRARVTRRETVRTDGEFAGVVVLVHDAELECILDALLSDALVILDQRPDLRTAGRRGGDLDAE